MLRKKVAIILLNYNRWRDTVECIESLLNINYINYQIIVCDNHSTDDSFYRLRRWAENNAADFYFINLENDFLPEKSVKSRLIFIETVSNRGFAGGNNIAIEFALKNKAEYILLLNNDTTVDADFLAPLVEACEKDPEIGMAGGKIYYYDHPERIWAAGGGMISLFSAESRHFGLNETDNEVNSAPADLDYITGCLLFIRSKVIKEASLMDEKYFLYYEESDWAWRVKKAGYKIRYIPGSKIYHKVSAAVGSGGDLLIKYYMARNQIYFVKKNFTGFQKYSALLYAVMKNVLRVVFHFVKGNIKKSNIIRKALRDGLTNRMGAFRL